MRISPLEFQAIATFLPSLPESLVSVRRFKHNNIFSVNTWDEPFLDETEIYKGRREDFILMNYQQFNKET